MPPNFQTEEPQYGLLSIASPNSYQDSYQHSSQNSSQIPSQDSQDPLDGKNVNDSLTIENNDVGRDSKVKKVNLILLAIAQLLGGLTFSLLSPFYTEEATQKGLTVTQCSWVFGSAFITTILFSPIFGKYIEKIGSRNLFLYGTILSGATNILFGFLQWIEDPRTFLSLSLVVRTISAIGESAFFNSIYPLTTKDAPAEKRSSILSIMETLHGFGLMVGPFLGGLLYEIGGFYFPFLICGGLLMLSALASILFEINKKGDVDGQSSEISNDVSDVENMVMMTTAPTTYRKLIKIPSITICCLLLIIAESSVTWYLATLQPMLEQKFGLRPVSTGAMFMVEGATYAIFSPIWGFFLDKKSISGGRLRYIPLIIGVLGVIFGYILLFDSSNVYIVAGGLLMQGSCVAATFIATLVIMMEESVTGGCADSEQTRAMITSLWFISENVAGYIGSALGGYTYDIMGFEYSTLVVIAMQILALIAIFGLVCKPKTTKLEVTDERKALLGGHSNSRKSDQNANYQSVEIV